MPPPAHTPQLSTSASPKQSPLQSWSLLASWPEFPPEHTPQSSTTASPKQSPLQSWSLLASWPEFPPEHTPQSSTTASPKQSPLQSWSAFPPSHTPQSSNSADPPQTPSQSSTFPSQSQLPSAIPSPPHTPHSSTTASPPQTPLQSSTLPSQSHAPSAIPSPLQTPHSSTCPTQSSTSSQIPSESTSAQPPQSGCEPVSSNGPKALPIISLDEKSIVSFKSITTLPSKYLNDIVSPDNWLLQRDTSHIVVPPGGKKVAPSRSTPLTSSPTNAANWPSVFNAPSIKTWAADNVALNSKAVASNVSQSTSVIQSPESLSSSDPDPVNSKGVKALPIISLDEKSIVSFKSITEEPS